MKSHKLLIGVLSLAAAIASVIDSHGQTLPGSISFTVAGRFQNAIGESDNAVLVRDNNLTNGYNNGFDLHDAPAALAATGPAGSAAFQWGTASSGSAYAYPSALWFEPLAVSNVAANQIFNVGYLHYRNGTIQSGTGASEVDLQLTFTVPNNGGSVTATYSSQLINTPNIGTPEEQADIVSLPNIVTPLSYKDAQGNAYYLELAFRIDDATINNSLSNSTEFRVFEGSLGRAEMIGRITTTPGGLTAIPEPATALFGTLFPLLFLRRQRRA